MELDTAPFFLINKDFTDEQVSRVPRIKFKTVSRDESSQEYFVHQDNNQLGVEFHLSHVKVPFLTAVEACEISGDKRYSAFAKCLMGDALNVWNCVLKDEKFNTPQKRTNENWPKAWGIWFGDMYNCWNARDVMIQGMERRDFKKP